MNKSQPYAQQPALSLAHGTRSANIYSINKLCLFFKWSLLIICKSLAENLSMWIQHLYTQSCYSIKRFFWIPYFMAGAPIGLGVRSWAKTPVLPWWVCRRCWPHQSTDKCGINCSGKMYNATDVHPREDDLVGEVQDVSPEGLVHLGHGSNEECGKGCRACWQGCG